MKFGFFSDVHGDLPALERALDCLKDVDQRICLGDLVGGSQDALCVARLKELGLVVVCGNHDIYPPETELLPGELQQYLAELPQCHREADFLALHTYFVTLGSYRSYKYLYQAGDAIPLLSEFPDRLFFLGHTHVPSLMTAESKQTSVRLVQENCRIVLDNNCRYIANPGQTSQGVVIYDAAAQTLEYRLFEKPLDRLSFMRETPTAQTVKQRRPWWRFWS